MHYLTTGFKTMVPALIILTLAWSLAEATGDLHTAVYLTSVLKGTINPHMMPVIIFILAALISFSTGSSWSTMAILYPIAIPTTWAICYSAGLDPHLSLEILLNSIATVMCASVVGDHCSPISDTTILSSLASDCNHIDHVKTQMPYALTVAGVSIACSLVATYHGGGWGISTVCLIVSLVVLYFVVRKGGKPTQNYAE
jgi:Na+/H+ antiporter NhaC